MSTPTASTKTYTEEELGELRYRPDLQALAKEYKISANLKRVELIPRILEKQQLRFPPPAPMASPPATVVSPTKQTKQPSFEIAEDAQLPGSHDSKNRSSLGSQPSQQSASSHGSKPGLRENRRQESSAKVDAQSKVTAGDGTGVVTSVVTQSPDSPDKGLRRKKGKFRRRTKTSGGLQPEASIGTQPPEGSASQPNESQESQEQVKRTVLPADNSGSNLSHSQVTISARTASWSDELRRIDSVQEQVGDHSKQLGSIRTDLDKAKEEVKELQEKNAELAEKHAGLAEKHADLTEQHADLTGKHTDLAGKHAELAEQHAELRIKNAELEEQQAELRMKNAGLEERLAALENMILKGKGRAIEIGPSSPDMGIASIQHDSALASPYASPKRIEGPQPRPGSITPKQALSSPIAKIESSGSHKRTTRSTVTPKQEDLAMPSSSGDKGKNTPELPTWRHRIMSQPASISSHSQRREPQTVHEADNLELQDANTTLILSPKKRKKESDEPTTSAQAVMPTLTGSPAKKMKLNSGVAVAVPGSSSRREQEEEEEEEEKEQVEQRYSTPPKDKGKGRELVPSTPSNLTPRHGPPFGNPQSPSPRRPPVPSLGSVEQKKFKVGPSFTPHMSSTPAQSSSKHSTTRPKPYKHPLPPNINTSMAFRKAEPNSDKEAATRTRKGDAGGSGENLGIGDRGGNGGRNNSSGTSSNSSSNSAINATAPPPVAEEPSTPVNYHGRLTRGMGMPEDPRDAPHLDPFHFAGMVTDNRRHVLPPPVTPERTDGQPAPETPQGRRTLYGTEILPPMQQQML